VQLIAEAPDEFLDPITQSLMRDPVIMPASRQTIDRPTILRHLMTDPRDPISRASLTPEDLLPAPELKARISEWLAARRRGASAP
jgi:U-box domain